MIPREEFEEVLQKAIIKLYDRVQAAGQDTAKMHIERAI